MMQCGHIMTWVAVIVRWACFLDPQSLLKRNCVICMCECVLATATTTKFLNERIALLEALDSISRASQQQSKEKWKWTKQTHMCAILVRMLHFTQVYLGTNCAACVDPFYLLQPWHLKNYIKICPFMTKLWPKDLTSKKHGQCRCFRFQKAWHEADSCQGTAGKMGPRRFFKTPLRVSLLHYSNLGKAQIRMLTTAINHQQ